MEGRIPIQIKSVNGEIVLDRPGAGERRIILSEEDAAQLVNQKDGQGALQIALAECRQYNAAAKREKIAALRKELADLEKSL